MAGERGEAHLDSLNPSPPARIQAIDGVGFAKKKPKRNKYAFACATLASMTSIVVGYDIGVMSGAVIYIKRELKISDVQVEILTGILNIYCLIGAFAAGRTSDWLGRRYTVILAGAIVFIGSILMGFATNYSFLMAGRFVAGVGVGYSAMVSPVFIAELSPPSFRGLLTSFPEVFVNFGILVGYVSNLGFSKLPLHYGWRCMLGAGAVPSVLIAISVLAMPESPRWLVMQGRLGDAKRVLLKISDSGEDAQLRLDDIKEAAGIPLDCEDDVVSMPQWKKSDGEGVWRELLRPTPSVRRILLAGVGIHFFQQSTGIDAVVLYSPRIFKQAGINGDTPLLLATVAVGFVKTIFILLATFTIDRFGRRPLLLISVAGMIFSLITLATSLLKVNDVGAIFGALSYVAWFSIGLGPIAWVYSSEIYPLRLRAQGASIGVAVNRVVSGVITMTFLSLAKAVTIGGAFYLFSGVAVVGWVFFYVFLPETRGQSLEDMDSVFGEFRWMDSVMGRKQGNVDVVNDKVNDEYHRQAN